MPPSQGRVVASPQANGATLRMGLLDSISSFLQNREGDFVKLEDSESGTGPGPLLILFNLPEVIRTAIDNDEYLDMISDGAPKAFEKGVIVSQISRNDATILDMPMSDALEKLVSDNGRVVGAGGDVGSSDCPVALFSGFRNDEMMAAYNIVGKEIYEESGGSVYLACAKAVPNAMAKPLRQVMEEIGSDHEEAMSASNAE